MEVARSGLLEAFLVNENEIVFFLLRSLRGIPAPLRQTGHFLGKIDLTPPLGLDNPDFTALVPGNEVRGVMGEVSIFFDVIHAEANGKVVLRVGLNVWCILEKGGKLDFEFVMPRLAHNEIKNRFVGWKEGSPIGPEWTGMAQLNSSFDSRCPGFLNGQVVYGRFEGVENNLPDARLGQVSHDERVFQVDRRGFKKVVAEK